MSEHILLSLKANVFEITISRPERKNAMTGEMYGALAAALRQAQTDNEVRVVLIKGQPGVFCAGNDIDDFIASPPIKSDAPVWSFFSALMELDKPVVAAVDGAAIGIGTTMLLHCDLAFATPRSVFALPFTSLGITPEGASTVLLPLLAGRQRATELLMLGKKIDAARAELLGLLNDVVPPEELLDVAGSHANALAQLPEAVVRRTKRLIQDGLELHIARQYVAEREALAATVIAPAAQQAFAKFLGKRKTA
ncbi:enoyl-CoA hydratase-related protein [Paraburkholderia sp. ZP32-5]|uniref:enoyl-CoA hydratase-related protein n=1 Tax=Paraburkholderia sp. ZP32-5 TaxID=2883245 RepID=UPI001F46D5CF|nr:enoyl-CoA hydratase-related protein [Paraburkholderia sp. ZP32-5]